jgi:hypothetical protein
VLLLFFVQEHGSKGHRGIGFITFQSAGMYMCAFQHHFGGKRLSGCWGSGSELKQKQNDWMTLLSSVLFSRSVSTVNSYRECLRMINKAPSYFAAVCYVQYN